MVDDGGFIPTYMYDLPIYTGRWEVQAPVGFSERLRVGFNVLGRIGIFDQFQICFHERTHRVTFQKL